MNPPISGLVLARLTNEDAPAEAISSRERQMLVKWVVFDMMGVIFEAADDVNELSVPFLQTRESSVRPE